VAASDNVISGPSVAIAPPSSNNRQIIPSRRKHEISRKLDSEGAMKDLDCETIIFESQ
jgi:hypothetical protein